PIFSLINRGSRSTLCREPAMKLLIVEDDTDTSSFIRFIMEQEQYEVRTAATAFEARTHLDAFKPDLIILDRGLPDADGLEFCQELKTRPHYAHIPVLFLSAAKTPPDIQGGLAAGRG